MRHWLRGNASAPPTWALVMEAAKGDPLRAQEIEKNISARWWLRWLSYQRARVEAHPPQSKK